MWFHTGHIVKICRVPINVKMTKFSVLSGFLWTEIDIHEKNVTKVEKSRTAGRRYMNFILKLQKHYFTSERSAC